MRDASWGAAIPSRSPQLPQSQHGAFLALICGGGVRRAVVACGGGELGGGVGLFSMLSDGTLRGEMKRYVKNMSGHKFAERGGDVLQIYVFMTNIHIIVIGLKIGLKRHEFVSL